jgi:hypothetical protein
MSTKNWLVVAVAPLLLGLFLGACNPNPQPEGLTPIPALAPAETPTLAAAIREPTVAAPAPLPVVAGEVDAFKARVSTALRCVIASISRPRGIRTSSPRLARAGPVQLCRRGCKPTVAR